MRKLSFSLAVLAIVAGTACIALADATPNADMAGATGPAQTYPFNPMTQSGQKGTLTLVPMGDNTRVIITLTGEPDGAIQPAHIHKGDCANPGAVIIPLTDVVAGHSMTVVKLPIGKVAIPGDSANVHQSAAKLNVYVACADIKMATTTK